MGIIDQYMQSRLIHMTGSCAAITVIFGALFMMFQNVNLNYNLTNSKLMIDHYLPSRLIKMTGSSAAIMDISEALFVQIHKYNMTIWTGIIDQYMQ